jgi:DNA repair exonuclease SbcCD ATPase subunit
LTAPRLLSLEIEAFRGFANAQPIDLDADVVVIRGDNGTGKTSIVDALLWVLTGELAHITERVRGLRRSDDPIINRYSSPPARVALSVRTEEAIWIFERTGSHAQTVLSATRDGEKAGDAAEALARTFGQGDAATLASAVQTWGVLRQDALRASLEAGAALHQRMSAVVGLDRVHGFTAAAEATLKEVTRARTVAAKSLSDLRGQQEESQRRVAELQLVSASASGRDEVIERARSRLVDALPVGMSLTGSASLSSRESLATLGTQVADLLTVAQAAAARYEELSTAKASITASAVELQVELDRLEHQIAGAFSEAPRLVQLAEAATVLLGDNCPVCGQAIDEKSVREHLVEVLRSSQEALSTVAVARDAAAALRIRLSDAKVVEGRRQSADAAMVDAIETLRAKLQGSPSVRLEEEWLRAERTPALVSVLENLRQDLRALYAEAGRDPEEIVVRASRDLTALTTRLGDAQKTLSDLSDRHARATTLSKLAHEASERLVARALERLEPTFAEVFDRLAPHPTFTRLRANQDIFYGKNQVVPEVYDPEQRIAANPLAIYSEGQLNVVALSYFLGLALNARDGALPFIVLDDPLQAMDVVGVLGFADLCRRVREQRQLVVTTHDRRFADVLARKLAPREGGVTTLIHEFDGWTREGPVLQSVAVPVAEVASLLDRMAS